MGSSNRDVGGYRGRRTVTDVLKMIAIVLVVLVVLAVAGVVYLQRYMVYTDEGVKLELPPFLQMLRGEKEPAASVPEPGDLSIDIQPAGSGSQSQEPEPVQKEPAGFALTLPVSAVADGSAAGRLAEAGADMLILEMKDQEGQLAWLSGRAEASRSKVNGTQEITDALRQWNAGDVYTIARVCCFRDNTAPYYHNPLALRSGNGNWKDELGLRWLSPSDEKAQAYIVGLCGELAELGFDEIVLEHYAFPVQGKLDRISKGRPAGAEERTAQVTALLTQVQQAAAPYGTKISLRVERDTLTGGENDSGITASLVEQYAGRVWMAEDGLLPAPLDLLEQAGITGGTGRLVVIAPAHTEGSQVVQAVPLLEQ
ncbi:hypothetical protein N510_002792 [Firmicutes bacterium ASF500]|nr:hypothetical protein N510_002792 [Firmicutes bacterium ASF500]